MRLRISTGEPSFHPLIAIFFHIGEPIQRTDDGGFLTSIERYPIIMESNTKKRVAHPIAEVVRGLAHPAPRDDPACARPLAAE